MVFDESKHARGKGAQGGQFVSKGASSENDTVGYDAKHGTGAGYGAKGGDKRVKQLQTALNELGLKDSAGNPLKVDGKLGPRTTAAIKRAQRRLGLPADGKVSPALLKQIREISAKHKAGTHKAGARRPAAHHKPATHHKAPAHHRPAAHHKPAPKKAAPKPPPARKLTAAEQSHALLQRV